MGDPTAKTATPTAPATKTITLKGDPAIDTDGSRTAFDPTTADGKKQINDSGPSGFIEVPKGTANSQEFTFTYKDGSKHKKNLAVNPDTQTFVSKTWPVPANKDLDKTNPERYFDADTVSFVALTNTQAQQLGVKLGDKVKVTEVKSGKTTEAIFGDSAGNHPNIHLEMSPAAAKELGITVDSKGRSSGTDANTTFKVEALPTPSVTATGKKVVGI